MALAAAAQQSTKLPKTSRTVYKCQVGNEVKYSHEPCLGAQLVDVTPTRGLDKDSGKKKTGADVRAERHQEMMTEVMRPVLGMTHDERMTMHRRSKLTPAAKRECDQLDAQMARLAGSERATTSEALRGVQQMLLVARTRSKSLGC